METMSEFRERVQQVLDEIGEEVLAYDKGEFWMVRIPYEYIEFYAYENRMFNTAIALPLARGLHDGAHRKSSITKNGQSYRLPYLIHCLVVCRMLVNINLSMSREEEDILLASALCHDMIEDIAFSNGGTELADVYHLDPRVYETVKAVSKRKDFTTEEEEAFFKNIQENKMAMLVKLSDRGHNVEDLYNMPVWKVHEYVGETNRWFRPMWEYGLSNYPEMNDALGILRDKIITLTQSAEIMVDRYEERIKLLRDQMEELQRENVKLRTEWDQLRNEQS